MGTKMKPGKALDEVVSELEQLADEIKVKLHLANMDAKSTWNEKLEPRLFEARQHAKEAGDASRKSIEEAVEALKSFSRSL